MKKTITTAVLASIILVLTSCGETKTEEAATPAVDTVCVAPSNTLTVDSTCVKVDTTVKK
jgi:hypothetical protein